MDDKKFKNMKRMTILIRNVMVGEVRGKKLSLADMGHPALEGFEMDQSGMRAVLKAMAMEMLESGETNTSCKLTDLTDEQRARVLSMMGAALQVGISSGVELLSRIQDGEIDCDDEFIAEIDKVAGGKLEAANERLNALKKEKAWKPPVWGHHD